MDTAVEVVVETTVSCFKRLVLTILKILIEIGFSRPNPSSIARQIMYYIYFNI